jgi:hypothetical protein
MPAGPKSLWGDLSGALGGLGGLFGGAHPVLGGTAPSDYQQKEKPMAVNQTFTEWKTEPSTSDTFQITTTDNTDSTTWYHWEGDGNGGITQTPWPQQSGPYTNPWQQQQQQIIYPPEPAKQIDPDLLQKIQDLMKQSQEKQAELFQGFQLEPHAAPEKPPAEVPPPEPRPRRCIKLRRAS